MRLRLGEVVDSRTTGAGKEVETTSFAPHLALDFRTPGLTFECVLHHRHCCQRVAGYSLPPTQLRTPKS